MTKKKILSIMLFYPLAYLITYIVTPFLFSQLSSYPLCFTLLIAQGLVLLGLLVGSYVSWKINNENYTLTVLGIKRENLGDSFILATALSTPIPLLWLIGTQIMGIDTMLVAAKPSWVEKPVSLEILLFTLLFWFLVAVVALVLLEAFPYELLKGYPSKTVLTMIVILWAGLYNVPFLSGLIDPIDVIFFGALFTLVYHKTRNSSGLILSYLLNENPLWWVVSAVFGPNSQFAFLVFLILRSLICFVSLILVVHEILTKCVKSR